MEFRIGKVRIVAVFVVSLSCARCSTTSFVQKVVLYIAVKMHNGFKEQNRIHGDAMGPELSMDISLIQKLLRLCMVRSSPEMLAEGA